MVRRGRLVCRRRSRGSRWRLPIRSSRCRSLTMRRLMNLWSLLALSSRMALNRLILPRDETKRWTSQKNDLVVAYHRGPYRVGFVSVQ